MIETQGTRTTSTHYRRMGFQECQTIHLASLEILAKVGVDVHDEKARQILIDGGGSANGTRVRLPEHMVERGLAVTPKRMILHDRHGRVALRAGQHNTYYGGGSD